MEDARISGTNQFLSETKCFASKLLAYSKGKLRLHHPLFGKIRNLINMVNNSMDSPSSTQSIHYSLRDFKFLEPKFRNSVTDRAKGNVT